MSRATIAAAAIFAFASSVSAADLMVTNTTDLVNGDTTNPDALVRNPGADGISLREALAACNQVSGPHTISFDAALVGKTIFITGTLNVTQRGIAIAGPVGLEGKPGIILDANALPGSPPVVVAASDFTLVNLQLLNIRNNFGVWVRAGGPAPQTLATIRIEGNWFVSAGVNTNQSAISVGVNNGAVGASISDVTIRNNTIRGFLGDGDGVNAGLGSCTNCSLANLLVAGNLFADTGFPVELGAGDGDNNRTTGTVIKGNTFSGNHQAIALGIGGSPGRPVTTACVISDTEISSNVFRNNEGAIALSAYSNVAGNQVLNTRILQNDFSGNGTPIFILYDGSASGPSPTGNTIDGTIIAQNLLSGNTGSGGAIIYLAGGSGSSAGNQISRTNIANNVFSGNQGSHLIQLLAGDSASRGNRITGTVIANNTIANNPLGGAVIGGIQAIGDNAVTGLKVLNTIFVNHPRGDFQPGFLSPADAFNNITADSGFAGVNGNLAADPKFVDLANADFHLRPGSPAIDAGSSEGAVATDFEGRPRFDDPLTANTGTGTAKYFDVGAYEFAPVQTQSRLINLSILTSLSGPNDSFTVGTVLGGGGTGGVKPLLVRADGPSLGALGVGGTLADPKFDVFSGQALLATNDNWGGAAALSTVFTQVGAFAYASAASKDAAIYNALMPAGAYTVQVTGVSGATGNVLAELYDATPAGAFTVTTPRLVNVSVLKPIGVGEVLTAGFVIGGTTSKQLLIRAVGPALGLPPFGAQGVMADPQLVLYQNGVVAPLASNDDWGGGTSLSTALVTVGAFPLPAASKDAALLVTLAPGNYTAQASGLNGTSGLVLLEVYEMP